MVSTILSTIVARIIMQQLNKVVAQVKTDSQTGVKDKPFINEFSVLGRILLSQINKVAQKNKQEKLLFDIASSTAHDIRSPISTLEFVNNNLGDTIAKKHSKQLSLSILNIKQIAEDLLTRYRLVRQMNKAPTQQLQAMLISAIAYEVVKQKQLEFCDDNITITINISSAVRLAFASITSTHFKRVLSNLINNAAEASEGKGQITCSLQKQKNFIHIRIADSGKGLSKEQLAAIDSNNITTDKLSGSGLGLLSSKQIIEAWGGKLSISSKVNIGTIVTIKLPISSTPQWFLNPKALLQAQHIVIVEPDKEEAAILKSNIKSMLHFKGKLSVLHSETKLAQSIDSDNEQSKLYLVAFNHNRQQKSGIHIINTYKLTDKAILMSNQYDEALINDCRKAGIRFIPKILFRGFNN